MSYRIVQARPNDPRFLGPIELAAARLLEGHAPESVLNEVTAEKALQAAQRDGRLWVALEGDSPVGFAHVELLEPNAAHLNELDVHPEHGRRGLGRQLVHAVCRWAGERGYSVVTLTTFRDVPWNKPFYSRVGFEEIPAGELSSALKAVLEGEANRGLDPARRVAMRRWLLRVRPARLVDRAQLLELWERSVRATHDFLAEEDIVALRPLVREELASDTIDWWVLESERRSHIAFLGRTGNTIEALFVDADHFHQGCGRALVEHAKRLATGALRVDVNEQNHAAYRFYEKLGFSVIGRSPTDTGGRPFPILHMRLDGPA